MQECGLLHTVEFQDDRFQTCITTIFTHINILSIKEKVMSVLLNKDKTELIVTCKCGQDAAHFRIDKDEYNYYCIATLLSGNWYRDQGDKILRVIGRKLKKIWAIIRNKDFYYSEIIMNKDEFEEFREYVNSIVN